MIDHYTAEEYSIGHEVDDPIAPSVDSYDEYPSGEELHDYAHRDVIAEVAHETGYYTNWMFEEMNIDFHNIPYSSESFLQIQNIEPTTDTDFHVVLEGSEHLPSQSYHIGELGDPLEDRQFLRTAVKFGYNAVDIASEFAPLSPQDCKERLEFLNLIEDNTVEIDGEVVDLEQYHDKPVRDPRLLERFDEAGYSVHDVASELGVTASEVTKQVEAYKLAE